MLIRQIANATATLGRPEDMTDEECAPLAVRQELVDGLPCMTSEWQPTEEERQQIAAGGAVWLRVFGHAHPPVMVEAAPLQEQGQVIVPYVLTSAMRAAFHEAHEEYEEGGFDSPDHQWSAMVNAYEVH